MSPADLQQSSAAAKDHRSVVFRVRYAVFSRAIRRAVGTFEGKRIGDFGCGPHARFSRPVLPDVSSAVLTDVTLDNDLKANPKVQAIEGFLPAAVADLPSESLDVILLISCLEHLTQPNETLAECRRLLAPGGVLIVNVPSWRGKRVLEFLGFRVGLTLDGGIADHVTYYDTKDLWPLLRQAGFLPQHIRCRQTPPGVGLTTFAVCRREA